MLFEILKLLWLKKDASPKTPVESMFSCQRNKATCDKRDADTLRKLYPVISHWSDDAIQNSWDCYSNDTLFASSIEPFYNEEFLGYLYLCYTRPNDKDLLSDIFSVRNAAATFLSAKHKPKF